jgi:hypothetical protein
MLDNDKFSVRLHKSLMFWSLLYDSTGLNVIYLLFLLFIFIFDCVYSDAKQAMKERACAVLGAEFVLFASTRIRFLLLEASKE